jgi:hypothetical protein
MTMKHVEPPSPELPSHARLFLVGKNCAGNWVVKDRDGRAGGLFVNRAEALRYAMFENGHCAQAVVMVPGTLELEMSAPAIAKRWAG